MTNHLLYIDTRITRIVDANGQERTDISSGHAFIIDGCDVKYDRQFVSVPPKIYFHLDWGGGGSGNGFYLNDVLWTITRGIVEHDAPTNTMQYFPVKIED